MKIAHFLSVAVFRIFLYRVRCIEKSYIYNKVKIYNFFVLLLFYSSNSIRLYNDICLAVFTSCLSADRESRPITSLR